ncbi:MAG: tRNA (adenosine(37)-N6)-threonylcarbamoyltransferase complex dimerization subunit type 1 TsaB [Myxococcota bacterium]
MLLSLDCSTLTLSLALVRRDGTVLEERFVGPPKRQSEILPGEIDALVKAHGLTLAELSGFVVGLGPGSFTGLRIGLATAKGLAYALQRPIVGASSLAACALDGPGGVELFSTAVVKKGELYVGRYGSIPPVIDPRSRWEEGRVETSMTVAELAELLKSRPDAKVLGPALVEYRAPLEALGVPASQLLPGPVVPSAVALTRLVTVPDAFDPQALFALEPHYLRGSGAEENPKFPPLPGVEPKARLKED